MDANSNEMEQYILAHIDAEPDILRKVVRKTHLYTLKPRMMSGHLQGRMLKMFCAMMSARRVIEIGTFTCYSALCMAEALPEDGELHTIDIDDEKEEMNRQTLAEAGAVGSRIHLHIGDAEQIIPQLEGEFDLCFMDGNKRHYTNYLDCVYPKLRIGGLIIADNTLWDGHVLEQDAHDAQTLGIMRFNDLIASDDRFEKVIVPIRDGMTLIRKVK